MVHSMLFKKHQLQMAKITQSLLKLYLVIVFMKFVMAKFKKAPVKVTIMQLIKAVIKVIMQLLMAQFM